jgi:hypothetical protein
MPPQKAGAPMVPVEAEVGVDGELGEISQEDCVEGCASLAECFRGVVDARKARGIRFPLASTLALCVVGFLCGRQNLTQVMRFGRAHRELLKDLGFRRPRAPSVPTLSRLLGAVKVSDLQEAFSRWLGGLVDSGRKRRRCRIAAVDGKSSRAAGVHVLNVFLHDVQQVIWQVPIESKQNEISALKQSLDGLFRAYPFLQILTGDAMFAGEPLCSALIRRGRHYVFQIKADQKSLYEKLELIFAGRVRGAVKPASVTGEKKTAMPLRASTGLKTGLP